MSYLLDTCIVSDLAKRADAGLIEWAAARDPLDLHLSVLTLGEIQKGIDLLPENHERREGLETWLETELPKQFPDRLLTVTSMVARAYGRLAAAGERERRPVPVLDGLLLATAQVHDLTFVTRNVRDVEARGVPVLNPYSGKRP